MRSPCCLCVDPPSSTFGQLVHVFLRFEYGGHAIECDVIISNPVASTITKWRTFRLLRWMKNLHQSMRDHEILYADRFSMEEQVLISHLCEKRKKKYKTTKT
jgi:hypothetical protein